MDIDAIKPTLLDEMHNRGMTYEIEKVLAFLNITDERALWNCTGFLKGLGLVQAHVEDSSESVLFMEKKSLFDILKFVKGNAGIQGTVINADKQPASKNTEPAKADNSSESTEKDSKK